MKSSALGALVVSVVLAGCVAPIHQQRAAWYTRGHGIELKRLVDDGLARAKPDTPEAERLELMSFHVEPVIAWPKAQLRLVGAPLDMPDIPRTPRDTKAVRAERDAIEEMNTAIDDAQAAGGSGLLGLLLGVGGVIGGGGIGGFLLRMFRKHRAKIEEMAGQLLRKDLALDQADSMLEEGIPQKKKRRELGASRPDLSAEHQERKTPT